MDATFEIWGGPLWPPSPKVTYPNSLLVHSKRQEKLHAKKTTPHIYEGKGATLVPGTVNCTLIIVA